MWPRRTLQQATAPLAEESHCGQLAQVLPFSAAWVLAACGVAKPEPAVQQLQQPLRPQRVSLPYLMHLLVESANHCKAGAGLDGCSP